MPRPVDSITIKYRDETGNPETLNCPASDGLTVGEAVNRITNGSVTQDSHVISKNGNPCTDDDSLGDGDKLTASPRKTAGGRTLEFTITVS